jgi:protein-disulfide isomerase
MTTPSEPSRTELRDHARRERLEREQAQATSAARRGRLVRLGAVAAAALVVLAVIVVSTSANHGTSPAASSSGAVTGAQQARAMLAGIPQNGITLGDPKAQVRVVEFADLQCPFCRAYTLDVLPGLVRRYVRPGKVRMEFRALAFIGPDSVRAARVAEAAGAQDKLWDVVDLLYVNQGRENSGYGTDAFLRRVAGAVPNLDVARVLAERNGAVATAQLDAAARLATGAGINQTPMFLVGRGTALKAVDQAGVPAAIEAALAR